MTYNEKTGYEAGKIFKEKLKEIFGEDTKILYAINIGTRVDIQIKFPSRWNEQEINSGMKYLLSEYHSIVNEARA